MAAVPSAGGAFGGEYICASPRSMVKWTDSFGAPPKIGPESVGCFGAGSPNTGSLDWCFISFLATGLGCLGSLVIMHPTAGCSYERMSKVRMSKVRVCAMEASMLKTGASCSMVKPLDSLEMIH